MAKTVYIIGGPNGAGKTTFATEFLPHYADCRNFINADLIAQGIAPLAPEQAAIRAGRLMLAEIRRLSTGGETFAFESTLSGRSYLQLIRRLRHRGYDVHLFYLWVPEVDLLLSRVRLRVVRGGHNVPADVIRRRFGRSISNFLRSYRTAVSSWTFFDNSGTSPDLIAVEEHRKLLILQEETYSRLLARYGDFS